MPKSVLPILRKYQIVSKPRKGRAKLDWTQANLDVRGDGGEKLGPGPLLDPEVINRFLQADITPEKEWLDWMLLQSGGGKQAKGRSREFMENIKEKWFTDHLAGYTDRAGKHFPKLTQQQADAQWQEAEPSFIFMTNVGDQDLVLERNIFGFHRHWPGLHRIYEKVALAVNKFLKMRRKIRAVNHHSDAQNQISFKPESYGDVGDLEAVIKRVEQFFGTRSARKDVRIDQDQMLYDDEIIRVIVPLTYAAAVRFGWDTWAFADPNRFEQSLTGENNWNNPWKTAKNTFVYLHFKYVVPCWVSFENDKFNRYYLTNLAMSLEKDELRNFDVNGTTVFDEENRQTLTLADVRQMILNEPERKYDPNEDEYAMKRGHSVYSDKAEAEKVVKSFDAALQAIKKWGRKFDLTKITRDPLQAPPRPGQPAQPGTEAGPNDIVDSLINARPKQVAA